jgi:hypothetical protein
MFPLPLPDIVPVLMQFAPVFSDWVWTHAVLLVVGAILSPEKRTVTAALRAMGWPTKNSSARCAAIGT